MSESNIPTHSSLFGLRKTPPYLFFGYQVFQDAGVTLRRVGDGLQGEAESWM